MVAALVLALAGLCFADAQLVRISRFDMCPTEAVNTDGQVVYAGVGAALNIYNIYQRDFPQLMGTIEGHSSKLKALSVSAGRLFALWEREGLEIYDISDRYAPRLLGRFPAAADDRFRSFTTMDLDGEVVYLGGANFIASVDVSDPTAPSLLGYVQLNGAPMKLDYHNHRIFVAAGKLGLGAFFVPNPHQIFFQGSQPGVYTVVKAYKDIILYGRLDEPKPDEPSLFKKHLFSFPFRSPMVAKVRDDVVFAGGMANFAIYRLEEGYKDPKLVWNLPDMPTVDCVLKDDVIYLANSYRGLSVFDIEDVESPKELGRIETYDVPRRACLTQGRLYVAAGKSGVVVLDLTEPRYPQVETTFGLEKLQSVWAVAEHEGYIYVLGAREDLASNILIERYSPDGDWQAEYPVAHVDKLDPIGEIVFGDGYCAVSLGSEGIVLMRTNGVDLEDGYSLYDGTAQFCDLAFRGELLFASDYHGGYHIYDLSSGMPRLLSYIRTSQDGGNGIALCGKYLLAADGPQGLTIIDVSDPVEPRFVQSYPTVWGTDIAVWGDYAFLSDGQGGCKVFDISSLPEVELVAELPRSGYWTHIYADGDYIYGVDQYFGIYIYRLEVEGALAKRSPGAPSAVTIGGAFPNPFNAQTKIEFTIPTRTEVDLTIYDVRGKAVETLIHDRLPAGTYALRWDASDVPSGTYFAVLTTPDAKVRERLMLVK